VRGGLALGKGRAGDGRRRATSKPGSLHSSRHIPIPLRCRATMFHMRSPHPDRTVWPDSLLNEDVWPPHHPSHNCYARGCRTPECRAAHRTYERDRKRVRERPGGGPSFVMIPANEVRAHLFWLASRGIGLRQIAQVSGVSLATLRALRTGASPRVRSTTASRILATHLGRVTAHPGKHPFKQPHHQLPTT
jgi:hypothetical protein